MHRISDTKEVEPAVIDTVTQSAERATDVVTDLAKQSSTNAHLGTNHVGEDRHDDNVGNMIDVETCEDSNRNSRKHRNTSTGSRLRSSSTGPNDDDASQVHLTYHVFVNMK